MFSFIPKKKKQELQSGEIHIYSGGKNKEEISMGNGVWWRLALTRLANNSSAPHGGIVFFLWEMEGFGPLGMGSRERRLLLSLPVDPSEWSWVGALVVC